MNNYLESNKNFYLAWIALCLLATYLRLHQLGSDELWIDEAFTGFISMTSNWLQYLVSDNTPPLYYFLQRIWCTPFICNEFLLRLPSVLYGVLFICLTACIIGKYTNRKTAIIVALLIIASPMHVYYSQEARAYSLLLVTISLLFLANFYYLARPSRKRLMLLVFACLAMLFTHYLAAIILAMFLVVYLLEKILFKKNIPTAYFLAVIFCLIIFTSWLLVSIFGKHATSAETAWILEYFTRNPVYRFIDQSLVTFLVGPTVPDSFSLGLILKRYSFISLPTYISVLHAGILLLFVFLYLLIVIRLKILNRSERLLFFEFSAFLFIPLIGLLLISFVIRPVYVVGRYDLIALPAFYLLIGYMFYLLSRYPLFISKKSTGILLVIFAIAVLGVQMNKLVLYFMTPTTQGLKQETIAIERMLKNDSMLILSSRNAIVNMYYFLAAGYDYKDKVLSSDTKRFVMRMHPLELEQAPASTERFTTTANGASKLLPTIDSQRPLWVYTDQLFFEQNKLTVDPVSVELVFALSASGWSIEKVSPELNLIQFVYH